ncbi:J domain-containing protein [Nanchangia anserum]|uniref:J domain-containing protein n=1 Tax=Nanchangia anserum TaxID=2692125 RepID=A0A8I0GCE1_9ACTO|nr:J domain-containing protein [Nanchangia anserum]MBD3689426.1 J domain-containing protein [Nanchangia anserum]QOX81630.1 J domain-containing protein [Nanchangia anserum]
MGQQEWMTKDFYAILGVDKSADAQAIKKAYRKLARTYHPDHNAQNPQAEERFKEIGEAYAVLSDAEKRRQYDAIRAMAGGGARFSAGPGGPGGSGSFDDVFASMFGGATGRGGAGFGNGSFRFTSPGGSGGFEDVMSGLFGAGSRGGFGGFGQQPQRGGDLTSSTRLSFRQAIEGATLKLRVEGREMTVRVPAGVRDGQQLRLRGKGRQVPGGQPGDLLLTVEVAPHPVYSRSGEADLIADIPISIGEAVAGGSVEVPLLDGSSARIKIPAGTSSGMKLRLKGKGVRSSGKRRAGDLYARVRIVVPRKPSRDVTDAARRIDEAADFDPREGLTTQAGW